MKKIIYLLAFIEVAFTSCDPLSQTYKDLDALPQNGKSNTMPLAVSVSTSYASIALANAGIPTTLNQQYLQYADGSVANVTFTFATNSAFVPDATYSHIAYTMVASDYTFPGNTFSDLSATAVLNFLAYKYPTPVTNQLVVLTYNYFESGYTASTGTITTDSFLYLGGAWTKIYTVSANQYAQTNRGSNQFTRVIPGDIRRNQEPV